jgi:hypothetical protein
MPGSGLPFELSASVMSRTVTAKASSLSAIWTVPGAAVCTDFIVGMGTLACLVAGSPVSGLDRAAPEDPASHDQAIPTHGPLS